MQVIPTQPIYLHKRPDPTKIINESTLTQPNPLYKWVDPNLTQPVPYSPLTGKLQRMANTELRVDMNDVKLSS